MPTCPVCRGKMTSEVASKKISVMVEKINDLGEKYRATIAQCKEIEEKLLAAAKTKATKESSKWIVVYCAPS